VLNITGTYECKADAKGRFLLPSPLKKQLASVLQEGFVLKRSIFESCLELIPMAQWNLELQQNVGGLNKYERKNNNFIRKFTAGVKIIELDVSGRLQIPKDLHTFAGISKEVVLSCMVDNIEIWDKQRYEKAIDYDADEFADLTEEVLGNKSKKDDELS